MSDLPPPTWFRIGDTERFWDGEQWTDQIRSLIPAGPSTGPFPDPFAGLYRSQPTDRPPEPGPAPPTPPTPPTGDGAPALPPGPRHALAGLLALARRPWALVRGWWARVQGAWGWVRGPWTPGRLVTAGLTGLIGVVAVSAATVLAFRQPADAGSAVRSACTDAITSTGASVRASSLRSAEGAAGRWSVGAQATDRAGTQDWICHVVWEAGHATVLTAVPDTAGTAPPSPGGSATPAPTAA